MSSIRREIIIGVWRCSSHRREKVSRSSRRNSPRLASTKGAASDDDEMPSSPVNLDETEGPPELRGQRGRFVDIAGHFFTGIHAGCP